MNRITLLSSSLAVIISAAAMTSFVSSLPPSVVTTHTAPIATSIVQLPTVVVTPAEQTPTLPVVHVHARDPQRGSALVGTSSFDFRSQGTSARGSSSLHMPYYSFSNVN